MKKRPSITLLTVLLAMVFAAGIGVYSSYIGMKIYQESSDHLLESFSQISETFTLFVQRNWTVLSQWDGLLKDADIDHADSIGADMQANKESWHYSDFYLFNESTQYLTADGRRGSADSISGVIQEMYSEGGPIVSTYTASYGVPKIAFAMPLSRNMTLDGVTYTGLAVSYDTDVVDDLVDGSMYGGKSDCYIVRANGDIVLALEPQTELCEGMTNLYDIDAHAEWKYGSMDDIKDCVQLGRSGSAQFTCQGGRNYLVAIPTAFPDWTLVGIIRADEVDGAMHSVQQSTIIALGALCIFAVIIVVLALGMESQLRLRREEEERLSLEREKMQSDRLLQSMSRIVDRYSIINLDTDRYRYRELRNSEPLYPASGRYSDMVETISRRYVALTETENAKLSRLITPEYLRSVLRKPDDNLKIEYCSRTENAYMVLTVIPVEWHADGTVYEVMQVVQDIGQKIELENMANTDSMTGLFNERYFSRVLNICEEKKLPFVLYYLDLDRFKPINDTYGHLMGDRLLKEIAARLLRCIRSRDYAFRIGGDEFALIVSADMDEGQRARMAERIQTTLSAPVVLDGKELSVGGTDNVAVCVFDDFDYVALGHIHGPQKVGRETVRYCGTPLKYSFSEVSHKKSVTVVEMGEKGSVGIRTVPLVPRRDMSELRGTYNTLMLRENYEGKPFRNDYLHITLTDEEDIPNAVSNLRVVYPNLMRLDYDNARTRAGGVIEGADRAEQKPPLTLFGEFYESQNGTPMSEEQQAFADKLIASIWEEER